MFGELLIRFAFIFTAIDEDVVLARVRVHVTVHGHAALFGQSFDHRLGVPNGRIRFAYYGAILAVQVFAGERAACVAHDNAVLSERTEKPIYNPIKLKIAT